MSYSPWSPKKSDMTGVSNRHTATFEGMTEDEMVGWHHQLNGHEFEQTPGDGEGQGSLACWSPWGRKELETTLATRQQQ